MYKLYLSIGILFSSLQLQAQNSDTLYYFPSADSSHYGVKNQKGEIRIPAQFLNIHDVEWDQPIAEQTIEFMGLPADYALRKSAIIDIAPYNSSVYNRSGKLLYHPQWFDNGSDYWVEGKRRFVDPQTGLVGFVNEEHQVIIPAQWEFATTFTYGYAEVFQGYQKHAEPGGEHWTIVPDPKKIAKIEVINTSGEVVIGKTSPQSLADYELDNLFYPNPFPYTAAEQKIVDKINAITVLKQLHLMNHYANKRFTNQDYRYHIIGYPTTLNPYYTLQAYLNQSLERNKLCRVYTQTGEITYATYEGFIPLDEYVKIELADAKAYFQNHPDAINRFDVDQAYRDFFKGKSSAY